MRNLVLNVLCQRNDALKERKRVPIFVFLRYDDFDFTSGSTHVLECDHVHDDFADRVEHRDRAAVDDLHKLGVGHFAEALEEPLVRVNLAFVLMLNGET